MILNFRESIIESVEEKIDCNNCNKEIDCVRCILDIVEEVLSNFI